MQYNSTTEKNLFSSHVFVNLINKVDRYELPCGKIYNKAIWKKKIKESCSKLKYEIKYNDASNKPGKAF